MRRRRAVLVLVGGTIILALLAGAMPTVVRESGLVGVLSTQNTTHTGADATQTQKTEATTRTALDSLDTLAVKGRAPKTGYERSQFGNGWAKVSGCSTRDIILYRDLENPVLEGECTVVSGTLHDPYTGEDIQFGRERSSEVQIDHVVALSDAWQKGAQQLTIEQRKQLANDPLELLAVSGAQNQAKSDGDAATWLPKNKAFWCTYVGRQIEVKAKYGLWVTEAEKAAMAQVLNGC